MYNVHVLSHLSDRPQYHYYVKQRFECKHKRSFDRESLTHHRNSEQNHHEDPHPVLLPPGSELRHVDL